MKVYGGIFNLLGLQDLAVLSFKYVYIHTAQQAVEVGSEKVYFYFYLIHSYFQIDDRLVVSLFGDFSQVQSSYCMRKRAYYNWEGRCCICFISRIYR